MWEIPLIFRKLKFIFKNSTIFVSFIILLTFFMALQNIQDYVICFMNSSDQLYEEMIQNDEAKLIPGLGDQGEPARVPGLEYVEFERPVEANTLISDFLPYDRKIRDKRDSNCKYLLYDAELPSVSVVITFHNEPYSVLVRTVVSVLQSVRRDDPIYKSARFVNETTGEKMTLGYPGQATSSPYLYIKEVILVDDASTNEDLKGKLEYYMRTRVGHGIVKIIRFETHSGPVRARLAGAYLASGDVLLFLDAHCEPSPDFLRPLLQRLKGQRDVVVSPSIDPILGNTFHYDYQGTCHQRGGFLWCGLFKFIKVTDQRKPRTSTDPVRSPVMIGGIFAMNRHYFWEMGGYDEQMGGWGGDSLEMSLRVWMCGGSVEALPCSRVGHIDSLRYRIHPTRPESYLSHGKTRARAAEVWMDDYKEIFYLYRPDMKDKSLVGNVTERQLLRRRLQCHSFQWYLDNVYSEKIVPFRDTYAFGRFYLVNNNNYTCLDTLWQLDHTPLGLYPCFVTLFPTQAFMLTLSGFLRSEDYCMVLDYHVQNQSKIENGLQVFMLEECDQLKDDQTWKYLPTQQLKHTGSGLCLDGCLGQRKTVLAKPCTNSDTQKWLLEFEERYDCVLYRSFNGDEILDPDDPKRLAALRRICLAKLVFIFRQGMQIFDVLYHILLSNYGWCMFVIWSITTSAGTTHKGSVFDSIGLIKKKE